MEQRGGRTLVEGGGEQLKTSSFLRAFIVCIICLLICVSVTAQDSDRANHQNVPSARLNIPPGNYGETCADIEMSDGTLRATCQSFDGHWIKTELSDPSRCPGRIANHNGHLACDDSTTPSAAPQRVASTSVQEWDRTIAQFQHTALDTKEGAPGQILALAQTADGYLWIGTHNGLYRFDGVTFERYEPRSGGPLPSKGTYSLWSSNKGELWIGAHALVSVLKDGNLKSYTTRDGVPDGRVLGFAEDRKGTVWIACDGLARLEGNRWKKVGEDWNFPGHLAQTLFLDREGTLWVATENTLVFLPRGAQRFQPTRVQVGVVGQIAEAPNGKIWMAETSRSVRPVPLGVLLPPSDKTEIQVGTAGILFDQDGALWATTIGDGIRRASHPERLSGVLGEFSNAIESFTAKDGLTDDVAVPILQDREGNIWVGTQNGLDRFRKSDFVPVVLPVPLREPRMLAGNGGDLWLQGQNLWARIKGGRAITKGDEIAKPPRQPRAAYRDPVGTIWWLCPDDLARTARGRFAEFPLPEALRLQSGRQDALFAEDRSGVIWVTASNAGLFSMKNGVWERFEARPATSVTPQSAYTDWMGRVWFGYDNGTIIVIDDGNIQLLSPKGHFENILAINGRGRHIWVGGSSGLAFFDGSSFPPVIPADSGTLGTVWGIEETSDGGLWLGAAQGVIHIAAIEIQHFLSDSSYRVRYELFDSSDGLPGTFRWGWSEGEAQGTDGRLWFAASNGLAWLDPAHISRNTLPPPVVIQSLTADDKLYPYWASPALPASTGHLEIKFTALSLSIPERDHFRYKLEGYDKDWREIGTQRQTSYTNLSPRSYRFRVIASNNDGVWNEAGATLDFSVLPAWYQTIWFRSLCVAAFGIFLWTLYQLRLRQLARQFNMTLEARVNERTRIARELHDSLLQGFQGLMFRLQAVRDLLPGRPSEAMQALDIALDRGDKAIAEGRDTVSDLRESILGDRDVSEALTALSEELAAQSDNGAVPFVRVLVEGKPRELKPMLRDEIYRIGGEALRNAFRHAKAQKIEAEITYSDSEFLLHVRDDGTGIVPEVVSQGVRAGHWGLPGMRERTESFGGKLEVWSERGTGTEIRLAVPASAAYGKPEVGRKLWSLRKKPGGTDGHQP
jgi:signal transduction histidine kinase/ligand-binding sensor domain-containing protein